MANHAKGRARHFRRRLAMAGQAVRAAKLFCREKMQNRGFCTLNQQPGFLTSRFEVQFQNFSISCHAEALAKAGAFRI